MNKIKCSDGLQKNIIDKKVFNREISLCKKLNKDNGGKCCWGKCAHCGVIPLLFKLNKGLIVDDKKEISQMKDKIFNNE